MRYAQYGWEDTNERGTVFQRTAMLDDGDNPIAHPFPRSGEVAEIMGDAQYATVQAAIDAAADGATVRLLDNVNISLESDTLTIRDINLIIDLNGKSIASSGPTAIQHNATPETTLYMKDSSASGGGMISNSGASPICSTGNVTVSGGKVENSGNGNAIKAFDVIVSGGTVKARATPLRSQPPA